MTLRFHWRLIQRGSDGGLRGTHRVDSDAALPDAPAQTRFCRLAEQAGIDSVLVDFNAGKPDPMVHSLRLARDTTKLGFLIAHRAGLMCPTLFVKQVQTFSTICPVRIRLNMVAGHSPAEQRSYGDHLDHDQRYERLHEYLDVCRQHWGGADQLRFDGKYYSIHGDERSPSPHSKFSSPPEIYVSGNSPSACKLAARHGDCWLRFADTPSNVASSIQGVLKTGTQVGLRLSVVARKTRDEAVSAARSLVKETRINSRQSNERRFVTSSDASSVRQVFELAGQEWLTSTLWTGLVRILGGTALALVGSYDDVADAILEYQRAGVSQFILLGWPSEIEMQQFGEHVIPRVRDREANREVGCQ